VPALVAACVVPFTATPQVTGAALQTRLLVGIEGQGTHEIVADQPAAVNDPSDVKTKVRQPVEEIIVGKVAFRLPFKFAT
jgi:hypothetical protein